MLRPTQGRDRSVFLGPWNYRHLGPHRLSSCSLPLMRLPIWESVVRTNNHREDIFQSEWGENVESIVLQQAYADGMSRRCVSSNRLVRRSQRGICDPEVSFEP